MTRTENSPVETARIEEAFRAGAPDLGAAADATTGYVLENGRVVLSGPTVDLKSNPHVRKAYLGL